MIELYKPDMYRKDIYDINYKKLKSYGIKCILFDLDNTLIPCFKKRPTRKSKDLIEELKDMGFKVILFSNSGKKRLLPFKNILEVDCSASSRKPSSKKFKKVMNDYKFREAEIAIIGDQIMTDIFGGNRVGIFSILVNPIAKKEYFFTRFNRMIEKKVIKKLEKNDLFTRGKYYE
ncbi:MAG: YqeG family HAD IIIA-type phosphatase [Tenericutes bacterium]|nr:YqeG family HAD IIIA-type phosphatase [Mycoplasmatota bacterium]